MTTSRVIRGTRAKIFLYVCAVLIITGLIACYNSTLNLLDEVKKSNDICHQQQENLSTQLQVVSDYKQKLEKTMRNERAEHQQSKSHLENKINEEKSKAQKLTNDALLKYNSLQQHYKLLQTQHDDFKEEVSNTQKKQLEEVNSLQAKLKEIEEELKKVKADRENLKTQFVKLTVENAELNKKAENANETVAQRSIKKYEELLSVLEDKYKKLQQKHGEIPDEDPFNPVADVQQSNKPSEKALLNLPGLNPAESPSSSTKAGPKMVSPQSQLNVAKPLLVPSPTPDSAKKEFNLKPPQGVVEPPDNKENQNEHPQLQIDQKINKEDPEKENVAQEEFDAPANANLDGLGFVEDSLKQGMIVDPKRDTLKRNIDVDYKELQHEEEGDDDLDEYGLQKPRGEDVAIRN